MYIHTHVYTHKYINTYTQMHTHTDAHRYVHTSTYMHLHTCTHLHSSGHCTYLHTYTHTRLHCDVHVLMLVSNFAHILVFSSSLFSLSRSLACLRSLAGSHVLGGTIFLGVERMLSEGAALVRSHGLLAILALSVFYPYLCSPPSKKARHDVLHVFMRESCAQNLGVSRKGSAQGTRGAHTHSHAPHTHRHTLRPCI